MDSSVSIEPRTRIFDTDQLGEQTCHVETIRSDTTNALELLRVSLNAYRAHRGPAHS